MNYRLTLLILLLHAFILCSCSHHGSATTILPEPSPQISQEDFDGIHTNLTDLNESTSDTEGEISLWIDPDKLAYKPSEDEMTIKYASYGNCLFRWKEKMKEADQYHYKNGNSQIVITIDMSGTFMIGIPDSDYIVMKGEFIHERNRFYSFFGTENNLIAGDISEDPKKTGIEDLTIKGFFEFSEDMSQLTIYDQEGNLYYPADDHCNNCFAFQTE